MTYAAEQIIRKFVDEVDGKSLRQPYTQSQIKPNTKKDVEQELQKIQQKYREKTKEH